MSDNQIVIVCWVYAISAISLLLSFVLYITSKFKK